MKELLDRFGLTEIIGYFLPGLMVLCALLPWGTPDPAVLLGAKLGENEFVVGALTLVVAYALGLVLSIWGRWAQSVVRPQFGPTPEERTVFAVRWLKWAWAASVAKPFQDETTIGLMDIASLLQPSFSKPLSVDGLILVSLFRSVAASRIRDRAGGLIVEAEIHRRRYLFSLGVSAALLVLAGSSLIRLLIALLAQIDCSQLGSDAPWRWSLIFYAMLILAGTSLCVSFRMRDFFAREAWILALAACVCPVSAWLAHHFISKYPPSIHPDDVGWAGLSVLTLACLYVIVELLVYRGLGPALRWLFITAVALFVMAIPSGLQLEWIKDLAKWNHPHCIWLALVWLGGHPRRKVA